MTNLGDGVWQTVHMTKKPRTNNTTPRYFFSLSESRIVYFCVFWRPKDPRAYRRRPANPQIIYLDNVFFRRQTVSNTSYTAAAPYRFWVTEHVENNRILKTLQMHIRQVVEFIWGTCNSRHYFTSIQVSSIPQSRLINKGQAYGITHWNKGKNADTTIKHLMHVW